MSADTGLASKIVAPKGGRIHIVTVSVDEARSWKEAVRAAGPGTGKGSDVWGVGGRYSLVTHAVPTPREVVLVSFCPPILTAGVLAWGKSQRLCPASPRTVFAVSECRPTLPQDLRVKSMAAISPDSRSFGDEKRMPIVWWIASQREAGLCYDGLWTSYYWFAFVSEETA